MKLFQRIFFAALLAGLLAGVALAALHQWKVAPPILLAEVYENASPRHEHAAEVGAVAPQEHDESEWAPQDGAERIGYTVLADVLAAVGFAFVLAAVSIVADLPLTARNGLLWGIAGYVAFQLWPALGLPPELPGMPAAEVLPRQIWWWGTAIAAGAGFIIIAKLRSWTAVGIAIALLLVPHVIGAPNFAGEHASAVPAKLAAEFAANALATGAAFWLALGPLLGFFTERAARGVPLFRRAAA
jgi:cobalt transporter subunit CbtA